jgi:LysM repeat protein
MKKIILVLTFLSFCLVKAQTTTEHTVLEKETIYGISKKYNVSVEDIQNENKDLILQGLKIGQTIKIPSKKTISSSPKVSINLEKVKYSDNLHSVQPKESLFSIARLYDVSVQDLSDLNSIILSNGLKIGTNLVIPNKKKTLDGRARVINTETVFHIVEAKETKYSIAKKYGITIEQLEAQNPEIISNLVEGNRLAINVSGIKPKNDKEELMIALAEKQVALEKNKAKSNEVQDLQDKLIVQKEMNQKIIKINRLKMDLNDFENRNLTSAEKLKLVLEANKSVQEILISKLDSLVYNMTDDLTQLKKTEIVDLEESKKLEKSSYESIEKTNDLLYQLKKDLADNRKTYTGLMNKVQRVAIEEHQVYKSKAKENQRNENLGKSGGDKLVDEMYKIQTDQEKNDKKNALLFSKIDSLGKLKKVEIKRHIQKANFYSAESRTFDDKMAILKLKRYQKKVIENKQNGSIIDTKVATTTEIKNANSNQNYDPKKNIKIEILKNLKTIKNGYYLVVEEFVEAEQRDKFILKMMDSGQVNTSFLYNPNKLSYYVFSKYFTRLDEATFEYKSKESKPMFDKMFVLQVDNE